VVSAAAVVPVCGGVSDLLCVFGGVSGCCEDEGEGGLPRRRRQVRETPFLLFPVRFPLVLLARFSTVSDAICCCWWWCRLAVKKSKAEKDPNKPKRPPSAFFVFM
jgi:hypothetical protein